MVCKLYSLVRKQGISNANLPLSSLSSHFSFLCFIAIKYCNVILEPSAHRLHSLLRRSPHSLWRSMVSAILSQHWYDKQLMRTFWGVLWAVSQRQTDLVDYFSVPNVNVGWARWGRVHSPGALPFSFKRKLYASFKPTVLKIKIVITNTFRLILWTAVSAGS